MARLSDMWGIGAKNARKLNTIGIDTTDQLLAVAAHRRGRAGLAEDCGIAERTILAWVRLADLMRIKGIGQEYASLLESVGVGSMGELRKRRADRLHAQMTELNDQEHLVRRIPPLKDVRLWITQAKRRKSLIKY